MGNKASRNMVAPALGLDQDYPNLSKQLEAGLVPLGENTEAAVLGLPLAERGVSLEFLMDFAQSVEGDATTEWVVSSIIRPATVSNPRAAYVDMLPQGYVAPPQYYIVHQWSDNFHHLVWAILHHFLIHYGALAEYERNGAVSPATKERMALTYIFLDMFALPQCDLGLGPLDTSQHRGMLAQLQDAIATCDVALVVMDRTGAILSRLWCLWELLQAQKDKLLAGSLVLLLPDGLDEASFQASFNQLDVSEAVTSDPTDRARLHDHLVASEAAGSPCCSGLEEEALINRLSQDLRQLLLLSTQHSALQARSLEPSQPKACVELLTQNATLLFCMGQPKEAEPHLYRASELAKKVYGPGHMRVAHVLGTSAMVLQALGRHEDAKAVYGKALKLYDAQAKQNKRQRKEDTAKHVRCLMGFAHMQQEQGQLAEAQALLKRAVDVVVHAHGPAHPSAAPVYLELAGLMRQRGLAMDALPYARLAVQCVDPQAEGSSSREGGTGAGGQGGAGSACHSRSSSCTSIVHHPPSCRSGKKEAEAAVPPTMLPATLACLADTLLSIAYSSRTNHHRQEQQQQHLDDSVVTSDSATDASGGEEEPAAEAEALLRRAVQLDRAHAKAAGRPDIRAAARAVQLARLLADKEDLDGAEVLLEAALDMNMQTVGEQHVQTAAHMHELGEVLHLQGRPQQADLYLRTALGIRLKLLGALHAQTLETRLALVEVLAGWGRGKHLREALAQAREHAEGTAAAFGGAHEKTVAALEVVKRLEAVVAERRTSVADDSAQLVARYAEVTV